MTDVKTFIGDLYKYLDMIRMGRNFALSRWGDGELKLLGNKEINLLNKGNGEFRNVRNSEVYASARRLLQEAFLYSDKDYHIGISCRCCVGDEKHEYMKKAVGAKGEANLTWANIFVNSNYNKFLELYIPEFRKTEVVLISHQDAKLDDLPFGVTKHYTVPPDAWISRDVTLKIMEDISIHNKVKVIYLFAAGPYANQAVYELHKFNKNNTYIDIGSVFDRYLGLKVTRRYLEGGKTLRKTCIW